MIRPRAQARRSSVSRRDPVAALALVAFLALVGCAGRSSPPAPAAAEVSFRANVADAEVWVDGVFYPDALRRGILLRPGEHRIEIRHDDYHARYFEVTLVAGERHTIDAHLVAVLP